MFIALPPLEGCRCGCQAFCWSFRVLRLCNNEQSQMTLVVDLSIYSRLKGKKAPWFFSVDRVSPWLCTASPCILHYLSWASLRRAHFDLSVSGFFFTSASHVIYHSGAIADWIQIPQLAQISWEGTGYFHPNCTEWQNLILLHYWPVPQRSCYHILPKFVIGLEPGKDCWLILRVGLLLNHPVKRHYTGIICFNK